VETPPAFLFQGTEEIWTSRDQLEAFAAAYRRIGGRIQTAYYEGEGHGFLRDHPDSPKTQQALEDIEAFIRSAVRP
jgi:acetyl esterase/lipase